MHGKDVQKVTDMQLPPSAVREFQQVWTETTGQPISETEAKEQAEKVLSLLKAISRPPSRSPP